MVLNYNLGLLRAFDLVHVQYSEHNVKFRRLDLFPHTGEKVDTYSAGFIIKIQDNSSSIVTRL